jgi:hypothetical protein
MDPRCDPVQFLGTGADGKPNTLFASIRNPGGRITKDTMRSVLTLRALNQVSEGGTVAVVHHTGESTRPVQRLTSSISS